MPQSNEGPPVGVEQPFDAVLGAIDHGTHICASYETDEDLLDLVTQFCAAGARRGDLCLWMMPEGADTDALASAGVELHSADDAYQHGGSFEAGPMVAFWHDKLAQALSHNQTGLSASGHTRLLQQRDWQAFMDYENHLNEVIAGRSISLLCTYPLSACKAGDILDVVRAHEVALAKQQNHWSVIESHLTDSNPGALDSASRVASLSPRERQVLLLVAAPSRDPRSSAPSRKQTFKPPHRVSRRCHKSASIGQCQTAGKQTFARRGEADRLQAISRNFERPRLCYQSTASTAESAAAC